MDNGREEIRGAQGTVDYEPCGIQKAPIARQGVAVATAGLLVGFCLLAVNGTTFNPAATQVAVDRGMPQLPPRHENMDFDLAVALVNESGYSRSGGIEIVALTASDFRSYGQSIVSHQLTSDVGTAVSKPLVGSLKNRQAKQETSTEKVAIKQPLNDGYYKVRSIGVGADAASSTVAQVESFFLVQGGELYEIDANQWFEKSLANQAHGG